MLCAHCVVVLMKIIGKHWSLKSEHVRVMIKGCKSGKETISLILA
jgi:hypothetical protein